MNPDPDPIDPTRPGRQADPDQEGLSHAGLHGAAEATPSEEAVEIDGIRLAFRTHGSRHHPPLLMIQGLGMPLSAWPPDLIDALVDSGFRVITFDNRDVGHSQRMDHLGVPSVPRLYVRWLLGRALSAPYLIDDMAGDALRLMDALDIDSAHVVGISMGGMIAQALAIQASDRLRSLTSWMSTTGDPGLEGPRLRVALHLMSRPKRASPQRQIEYSCRTWRLIGSPGFPSSNDQILQSVMRIVSRPITVDGLSRQIAAIIASPGRSEALSRIDVPTLVIHGDADPLIPLSGGQATANAIPNARLHVIEGLGHDLPLQLHDTFRSLIVNHARSVG